VPRNKALERKSARTTTGAGATGASAGTLLVLLARNLPNNNPWKSWALIIAPSLSVLLSWLLVKARLEADYYLTKRNRQRVFDNITARIRETLDNPLTSEEHQASMRKELEQVEKLRIDAEREQLQLVLKEVD
jgi:hypothetical protein